MVIGWLIKRRAAVSFQTVAIITIIAVLASGIVFRSSRVSSDKQTSLVSAPSSDSQLITESPAYKPAVLKGVKVDPLNPFKFDFIVDLGDSESYGKDLNNEANKLIKYFLAALTVPDQDIWVNLSPYEQDSIIPEVFGMTEMGCDLLAQDYILKKLSASLTYPEDELGGVFWERVYKKVYEKYGTTKLPIDTFNKVWIVPDHSLVYQDKATAVVLESSLKVILEEDYLALSKHGAKQSLKEDSASQTSQINKLSSEIMKDIILPEIEKEVNEGKNFANLRQIYQSLILATWYKNKLKDSLLNKAYADKNKVAGVDVKDKQAKERIYERYMEAFKDGVYNYIKKDYDSYGRKYIKRKYFSGGFQNNPQAITYTSNKSRLSEVSSALKKGAGLKRLGRNMTVSIVAGFLLCSCAVVPYKSVPLGPVQAPGYKMVLKKPAHPSEYFLNNVTFDPSLFPKGYEVLESMSAGELVSLLGCDCGGWTLLEHIYILWQEETKSGFSYGKFLAWIQGLRPRNILKVLQVTIQRDAREDKPHTHTLNQIERILKTLNSDSFQQVFAWAQNNLDLNNAKNSKYEIYLILQNNARDVHKYVSALKTEEFKDFHSFVREYYNVNPNDSLILALYIYLDPVSLENYYSPTKVKAFEILRNNFPKVKFDLGHVDLVELAIPYRDIDTKTLAGILENGEYERFIKKIAKDCEFLSEQYGVFITDRRDLLDIMRDPELIQKLKSRKVKNIWNFYKQHYPEMSSYRSVSDIFSFYSQTAELFLDLKTSPEELSQFLEVFDKNLVDVDIQFLRQTKLVNFYRLSKDAEFKSFARGLLEEYPELKRILEINMIMAISRAYKSLDRFTELNRLIKSIGVGINSPPLDFPDFDLTDIRAKIKLLKIVKEGFSRITAARSSGSNSYRNLVFGYYRNIKDVLDSFNNGTARSLYDSFLNNWQFEEVELGAFLEILANPERLSFYLNSENARKFLELKRKYRFLTIDRRPIVTLQEAYSSAGDILAGYEFLSEQETLNIYQKFFYPVLTKGEKRVWAVDFERFVDNKAARNPQFQAVADELQNTYGLSSKSIGYWFEHDGIEKGFLEDLQDPKTKDSFKQLQDFFNRNYTHRIKNITRVTLLSWALKTKEFDNQPITVLEQLKELGFPMYHWDYFKYMSKHILTQDNLVANLKNPEFIEFYNKIIQVFYGGVREITAIPELSELYSMFGRDRLQILFSDNFEQALSYIRTEFFITDLDPSTLYPILRLAESFDSGKMDSLIEEFEAQGEKVYANDLILLNEILRDPVLYGFALNRPELERRVEQMLAGRPSLERKNLDQVSMLNQKLNRAKVFSWANYKINREIERVKKEYTERPNVSDLSSLFLIRAYIIMDALDNSNSDIVFTNIHSYSEDNGAYFSHKYGFFRGALVTFHLHAKEGIDNSDWAGYSGWLGGRKGDIPVVDTYNLTDAIATPAGHPLDEYGRPILNQISVDIVMYHVDKRDPNDEAVRILDVGKYIRPYGAGAKDNNPVWSQLIDIISGDISDDTTEYGGEIRIGIDSDMKPLNLGDEIESKTGVSNEGGASSSIMPSDVGGVDFTSGLLTVKVQGEDVEFNIPFDSAAEALLEQGAYPVIFKAVFTDDPLSLIGLPDSVIKKPVK